MFPTMMLAALVPSAVPGMDREATVQEASELLRGKWLRVSREKNGKPEIAGDLTYEFNGRKVTARTGKDVGWTASVRLVPSGRYYILELFLDDARRNLFAKGRLDFRGTQFRWLKAGDDFVVTVWVRQ